MKKFSLVLGLLASFSLLCAGEEGAIHAATMLVFQLGIIIFAAKLFGDLFRKIGLPPVLGEIVAGIAIGPYVLGSLGFWSFPLGLFPLGDGVLPISPTLYSISTLASIILLFCAGLETDLDMIMRFGGGSVRKLFGKLSLFVAFDVAFSFGLAVLVGMWYLHKGFMDPYCLFLGVLSTATSIGATARIISEKKKLGSPEGVTILSIAVLDDISGIIIFAVVLGVIGSLDSGMAMNWGKVAWIGGKAVAVWVFITILGLSFAHRISKTLKFFKNKYVFTTLAFGLALLVAGVFEKAGLAMIIGAYVTGLSLSKTDISYTVLESMELLKVMFVPIFFVVVGMMVDVRVFADSAILELGLVFSLVAVAAKVLGCGLPALCVGFNPLGAARIGLGMVPRGEVTTIVAGIGLAGGFISNEIFGCAIILVLLSTAIASPAIGLLFGNKKQGMKEGSMSANTKVVEFKFESQQFTGFLANLTISFFKGEGFFVHTLWLENKIFYIRKDQINIKLELMPKKIKIETQRENIDFAKALINEALTQLVEEMMALKDEVSSQSKNLRPSLQNKKIVINEKSKIRLKDFVCRQAIILDLQGENVTQIITEMIQKLFDAGRIKNQEAALQAVLAREATASTALGNYSCFPHAKTDAIEHGVVSLGISTREIEAGSMDKKPTKIFILILSSNKEGSPHIQLMTQLAQKVDSLAKSADILAMKDEQKIYDYFVK